MSSASIRPTRFVREVQLAPRVLAALAVGVGVVAATLWAGFGQSWEVLADGAQYLAMAQGGVAEAPFAFRPLAPGLAAGLAALTGLSVSTAFFAVSWAALALATTAYALVGLRHGGVRRAALLVGMWTASFAFAYGATTGLRADPLLALAVVSTGLLGDRLRPGWVLAAVAALGVLAHELALFGLLAVAVERAFGASLFTADRPASRLSWRVLAGAGLAALTVRVVAGLALPSLPSSTPNWTDASPLALAAQAVAYAGGGTAYGLRVYAAFGPALVFALAALMARSVRDRWAAFVLLAAAFGLTFLATDTLRVMAVASVVVLPLASSFVERLFSEARPGLAWAALALQAGYSVAVFGHLRTFELSAGLQVVAAALSLAALGLAAAASRDGVRSAWRLPTGRLAAAGAVRGSRGLVHSVSCSNHSTPR